MFDLKNKIIIVLYTSIYINLKLDCIKPMQTVIRADIAFDDSGEDYYESSLSCF